MSAEPDVSRTRPEPAPPPAAEAALEESPSRPLRAGRSPFALVLRAAAVIAVVLVVALLAWATLVPSSGETLVSRIAAGEAPSAPRFELPVLWNERDTWPPELTSATGDDRLGLGELRGRPVVLNFWASWCIPCREEAPILNAAARAYGGEVAFVGINVTDLRPDALAFLREFSVPYVSARDRDDKSFRGYGLTGVPETYFLDARGRIIAHSPGPITQRTLEAGIVRTLGTPRP